MSQEKVERYKAQKANRKEIMKKERRKKLAWRIGSYVILIALVGWIGYSAYDRFYVPPKKSYEVSTTAVDDYLNGLSQE